MRKKLLRLLRLVPIALAFWGVASAQVTGTLIGVVTDAQTGKPVTGALVVATSPALQGEQTAVTEADGSFRITFLPPGDYKLAVQLQGYKPAERSDIVLRVDKTLRANMVVVPEAVQMEEQVVKTGVAPVVNVGSAETAQVVTKEFIASIPVSRTYEGTAIVAPTAQRDLYGISFAGATSPENNYILDGLNVTDPQYGTLGTNVPTNFVEQVDVKVGSFMPEYGRTSAGIVNTVTKSGSNEYHGSVYFNVQPGALSPPQKPVGRNGEAIASFSAPYNGGYDVDFGLEVGGPILKDKLWFFAGFQPSMQYNARTAYYRTRADHVNNATGAPVPDGIADRTPTNQFAMDELAGTRVNYGSGVNRYYAVAKLTYLFDENHNVALTFNTQPGSNFGRVADNGRTSATYQSFDDNNTGLILRYLGKVLDKHLLIEGNLGWVHSSNANQTKTIEGVDIGSTPSVNWRSLQRFQNFDPSLAAICPTSNLTGAGTATGCFVNRYVTGGAGFWQDLSTDRYVARAALSGLFEAAGQHNLKVGLDLDYAKYENDRYYTGGVAWRAYGRYFGPGDPANGGSADAFYTYRSYADLAGTALDADHYTDFAAKHSIGKVNTLTNSFFLQDSWTILNQVTLNFGVRLDMQTMKNDTPGSNPFRDDLSINDMWSPRVQAIWDFTGQGRGKVQANWGRYYESIPLDMALRSFGSESQVQGAYQLSSCGAAVQPSNLYIDPHAAGVCPNVYGVSAGVGTNTVTLPANGPLVLQNGFYLQGPYAPVAPDLKGPYNDQFGGGVEYEVVQDIGIGVEYIGRRLGNVIEDMSSDDGINYFIANPAKSKPWTATSGDYGPGGSCATTANPSNACTFNPTYATALDPTTGSLITSTFPKPTRSYDAVTFKVTKAMSRNWFAQASYTYSSLRGNYPGLFRYENAQLDPNITSEYDLPSLLSNKYGPGGGNRRHQIKLYGSYAYPVTPDIKVVGGAGFTAFSGVPMNVLGAHPLYGDGEAFIMPRGMGGNLDWLLNLDLHGEVEWAFSAPYKLRFTVDVFNVWNAQTVQNVDQLYTTDFVQPIVQAHCNKKDSVTKKDPVAAVQADCPDLRYARTVDDLAVTPNLNWGQPSLGQNGLNPYQNPLRVRFGLAMAF